MVDLNKSVLDEIRDCKEFKFHLCGSRALHTERWDSDWDFCTSWTPEVEEYLRELGFDEHISDHYAGHNTIRVYQYNLDGPTIQIDLCVDVGAKMHVMKIMNNCREFRDADALLKRTSPSTRAIMWNAYLQLTDYQKGSNDV